MLAREKEREIIVVQSVWIQPGNVEKKVKLKVFPAAEEKSWMVIINDREGHMKSPSPYVIYPIEA